MERQKNLPKQVFLSEHSAWRYVFESLAVVFEHAFQDFTEFHDVLRICFYAGNVLRWANNMTSITKINQFVMNITPIKLTFCSHLLEKYK